MSVINIRGCNGAGKTTLVRKLIASDPLAEESLFAGVPGHYLPKTDTAIIGPYKEGKATGGMDNVHTTDEAKNAVIVAADQFRNVVFEGVLISTVFQTWLDVSQTIPGGMIWAFLDTPAATCLERVKQRRVAKGRPAEGFKEDLVLNKHRGIEGVRLKAEHVGEKVVILNGDLQQLVDLLENVHGGE